MKFWNKFDVLIIVLLASLSFGGVGGALSISRFLTIAFSPFYVFTLPCKENKKNNLIAGFLVFWLIYGVASLFWTSDKAEGIIEVAYYLVHFLLFLEILSFFKLARSPLQSVCLGWLIGFSITSFIGLWEITTDSHLYLSKQHSGMLYNSGLEIIQRRFASVTFVNYNGYVTYICFAFPFLLYLTSLKNKFYATASIVAMILSFVFVICNASRGGVISLCGILMIYLVAINKLNLKNVFLLIVIVASVFYLFSSTDLFNMFLSRSQKSFNSEESRLVLWGNVIKLCASDVFIGTGIGGMQESMKAFSTNRLLITHNLFLEILVQFGFLVFFPIVFFCLNQLRRIFNIQEKRRKWILVSLVCMMPFYTIIHSGYLLFPPTFAFFASVFTFIDYENV